MAPNNTQPEPTETSPLLGRPNQDGQLIDPGDGIAPVGEAYDETDIEDNVNEGDLERQSSNGERFKHQGLPEVMKRMKYIFPAVAIGVGNCPDLISRYRAERYRCFSPQRIRP